MTIDLSLLDTSAIPERDSGQDERVLLLVARKDADSANPDPAVSGQALVDLVESSGFDLAQSFVVTYDVDESGVTSGSLADLAASLNPPDPE